MYRKIALAVFVVVFVLGGLLTKRSVAQSEISTDLHRLNQALWVRYPGSEDDRELQGPVERPQSGVRQGIFIKDVFVSPVSYDEPEPRCCTKTCSKSFGECADGKCAGCPTSKCTGCAEGKCIRLTESNCDGCAKSKCADHAADKCDGCPEIKCAECPASKCTRCAEGKCSHLSVTKGDGSPNSKCNGHTDGECAGCGEGKCDGCPEKKCAGCPGHKSNVCEEGSCQAQARKECEHSDEGSCPFLCESKNHGQAVVREPANETARAVLEIMDALGHSVIAGTEFEPAPGAPEELPAPLAEPADIRAALIKYIHALEAQRTAEAQDAATVNISDEAILVSDLQVSPESDVVVAVDALRDSSMVLDEAASQLESLELYERADQVRALAQELRHDARRMKTGGRVVHARRHTCPVVEPTCDEISPSDNATEVEHRLHQLREAMRRGATE